MVTLYLQQKVLNRSYPNLGDILLEQMVYFSESTGFSQNIDRFLFLISPENNAHVSFKIDTLYVTIIFK